MQGHEHRAVPESLPMSGPTTADRGGRAGSSDPLGSIGWTERTGGVLTARECVTLARPLLREELGILVGRLAMALRVHSGRRTTIEPARLTPPDSSLARDAQEAAEGPPRSGAAKSLPSCLCVGSRHRRTTRDLVRP